MLDTFPTLTRRHAPVNFGTYLVFRLGAEARGPLIESLQFPAPQMRSVLFVRLQCCLKLWCNPPKILSFSLNNGIVAGDLPSCFLFFERAESTRSLYAGARNQALGGLHAGVRGRHLGRWRMRSSPAACSPYLLRTTASHCPSSVCRRRRLRYTVRCDIAIPTIRVIWGMSRSTQFGGDLDPPPPSANITHYRSTLAIVGRPTRGMMTTLFERRGGTKDNS